jgi:hypothetical protein
VKESEFSKNKDLLHNCRDIEYHQFLCLRERTGPALIWICNYKRYVYVLDTVFLWELRGLR